MLHDHAVLLMITIMTMAMMSPAAVHVASSFSLSLSPLSLSPLSLSSSSSADKGTRTGTTTSRTGTTSTRKNSLYSSPSSPCYEYADAAPSSYPFRRFTFAPNNVCINPNIFYCYSNSLHLNNSNSNSNSNSNTNIDNNTNTNNNYANNTLHEKNTLLEFTLKNVPGDGDCMFQAVALATSASMGLGGNDALLRAIANETRNVVAQVLLSSSHHHHDNHNRTGGTGTNNGTDNGTDSAVNNNSGNLHVNGKRIVRVIDLLQSAAKQEHVSPETYIELLRNGTLQGGGPELTVLSNILRRPISIYELLAADDDVEADDDADADADADADVTTNVTTNALSEKDTIYGGQTINATSSITSTRILPPPSLSLPSPSSSKRQRITCVGTFGDLFKDPCSEIPNPAVISGLQPGAYSWHIHVLIVDAGPNEKHACALLPKFCYQ